MNSSVRTVYVLYIKDIKLIEARSAANTWRSHQEQSTEEKAQLEAKITTLQQ